MSDLFKVASKKKYRFTYKGVVTVEDLWDLSVEELDKIYKSLKSKQKAEAEESLLATTSKEDKELNNKIEIVKIIVADKLEAREKATKSAEKRAKNQRILEIMADKADAELKAKSLDELRAMLDDDVEEDED
jgi:lipoate synthase